MLNEKGKTGLKNKRLLIVVYSLDDNNVVFSHQKLVLKNLVSEFPITHAIALYDNNQSLYDFKVPVWGCRWGEGPQFFSIFRYLYIFFKQILFFRPQVVFFHMTDSHCALVSPVLSLLNIHQVIWYAHKSNSIGIQISEKFVDRILTSTKGSFPFESPKVLPVGQSVDSSVFSFKKSRTKLNRGLYVGRFDESKRIDYIAEQFDELISEKRVEIIDFWGQPSNKEQFLLWKRKKQELEKQFHWISAAIQDKLNHDLLPDLLHSYDFFLNAFQGSLDKTMVEATLAGLPVLTTNQEYLLEFGIWPGCSMDSSLREQFELISILDPERLGLILVNRRNIAETRHGMSQWLQRVSFALES